ncbi:MAG: phage major capsid protein [Candidatus Nanoarchaeia archaeon]|nr:phage major capsid protein [Candidatus Nanoarchaeia archaeon]
MNPRLLEIEARKKEIRQLLEGNTEIDLNALEKELRDLENEKLQIEKREMILASMGTGETEGRTIEKPEIEERNFAAEAKDNTKKLKLFRNLGEQLKSIRQFALTGNIDERLIKINKEERAASGMNEMNPSEGGFALQTDFGGMLMDSAVQNGEILSRVDSYEISALANSVRWVDIDEESISNTVFGGVQVYWAAEAASVTASKPSLKERKLELEKLMGLAYATDEMIEDTNFISDLYSRAFEAGIIRKFEDGIVAGTGAGQPLGFLNANNKISQAKESGQAADTIIWENIVKMYNRRLKKPNSKFGWLMHPDAKEQLDFMEFPLGVGGVPVYLQESKEGEISTLKGLPIVESDLCSALGDEGDIMLVDFADYIVGRKGGIKTATSIHILFTVGDQAFRFTMRGNGMPKSNKTLNIKNSTKTRSGIVTLASRT